MRASISSPRRRRGTIVPLAAFLFMFLVAMVAFAVDTSWLVLTQSELQNAADTASLAGTSKLPGYFAKYSSPGANKADVISDAVAAAKQAARDNAAANPAGDVRSLTLADADIDVGHTNSAGTYTSNASDNTKFPNTVKITARRASGTNGSLKLFFGRALGTSAVNLDAKATSVAYTGPVNDIPSSAAGIGVLPMTYDADFWDYFLKTGRDIDGDTPKDTDGLGVLNLYSSGPYKGNFGLLGLDGTNANASTNRGWVQDGPSTADLNSLHNKGLLPLSSHSPTQWDWEGTPGFESSTVQEINGNVGKTFIIPLFKAYKSDFDLAAAVNKVGNLTGGGNYQSGTGQGSNYNYQITRFVAVKIVDPTLYGGRTNRDVMIQPAGMTTEDVTLLSSGTTPLGAGTTTTPQSFVFGTPKLTE